MTIPNATFNTSLLVESRLLVTLIQSPYRKFRFLELRKGLHFPLFSRIFNDPKLRIINTSFFFSSSSSKSATTSYKSVSQKSTVIVFSSTVVTTTGTQFSIPTTSRIPPSLKPPTRSSASTVSSYR